MLGLPQIHVPRDGEDESVLRENLLEAPLMQAELLAFAASTVSPLDKEVHRELAQAMRDVISPHVHTHLTRGVPIIRPERRIDEFPHKRALAELYLSHAFAVLGLTEENRETGEQYLQESNRLNTEATKKSESLTHHPRTLLQVLLIQGSRCYFAAAYSVMRAGSVTPIAETSARESLQFYEKALEIVQVFREIARRISGSRQAMADMDGIMAMILRGSRNPAMLAEMVPAIFMGEHEMAVQEILFGMVKCYGLVGDIPNAYYSYEELLKNMADSEVKPAPIVEYLRPLKDAVLELVGMEGDEGLGVDQIQARKNQVFIVPTPPVALERAQMLARTFSGEPQRIYAP